MNGIRIEWHEKVKHLGNVITQRMNDEADCIAKKSAFIGSVNRLLANFKHLDSHVRIKLFNSYCSSFYGAQMWKLECPWVNCVITAWNKGVRALLRLPPTTHRWLLGPLINSLYVKQMFHVRSLIFLSRAIDSSNATARAIVMAARSDARSDLGANFAFLRYEYDIDILPGIDVGNACRSVTSIRDLDEERAAVIETCKELINCIEGISENGLSPNENSAILERLCCQ